MCCFVKIPQKLTSLLSVGRIPVASGKLSYDDDQVEPRRKQSLVSSRAEKEPESSSGSESPLTVMELSGSRFRAGEEEEQKPEESKAAGRRKSVGRRSVDRAPAELARRRSVAAVAHEVPKRQFSQHSVEAVPTLPEQLEQAGRARVPLQRQRNSSAVSSVSSCAGSQRVAAEQEEGVAEVAPSPPAPPVHDSGRERSRRRSQHGQSGEDRDSNGTSNEEMAIRRRASRSQPPVNRQSHAQLSRSSSRTHLSDSRRAASVSPFTGSNVNIRHILENVAQVEGPFQEPQLALKVALDALNGSCWSTKVEGMLALIRLAAFHQPVVLAHLHELVNRIAGETRNLRSTVARSAIFALGDLCAKLKRNIESELDTIVPALLHKSIENTAFIREDIRRAFSAMLDSITHWRLANSLIHHGSNHKSVHVRRMAGQFVAQLVERMGAAKCLVGAREIGGQLIPAGAKLAQDSSPHTRYYGRLILARIMQHGAFERLLRKHLSPNLYRSTMGIIESIRRRGAGEPPQDT